jgi:hypothetical protein
MMGTYASVLATKKIRSHTDRYRAEVEGDIENVEGLLKITTIRVNYFLKIRSEEADNAKWAFDNYISLCPGAQSVIGCIKIEHNLELLEG